MAPVRSPYTFTDIRKSGMKRSQVTYADPGQPTHRDAISLPRQA